MANSPDTQHPDRDALTAAALEAATAAFAAARSARIILDSPGRLGADAVQQAQPISGARRASRKAQAEVAESAQRLERARDRWGALMRGLAADLDLAPGQLVSRVERAAAPLAMRDAATLLGTAAAALASLGPDQAHLVRDCGRIESELARLASLAGAQGDGDQSNSGPTSG
ncbi:MAG: hypothetical protein ACP5PW_02425 [Candidatus Dormibacteria bacterium]